jgi:hypothetical protein
MGLLPLAPQASASASSATSALAVSGKSGVACCSPDTGGRESFQPTLVDKDTLLATFKHEGPRVMRDNVNNWVKAYTTARANCLTRLSVYFNSNCYRCPQL